MFKKTAAKVRTNNLFEINNLLLPLKHHLLFFIISLLTHRVFATKKVSAVNPLKKHFKGSKSQKDKLIQDFFLRMRPFLDVPYFTILSQNKTHHSDVFQMSTPKKGVGMGQFCLKLHSGTSEA